MSAIGDYVHYSVSNYFTYGVSKEGERPYPFITPNDFLKNRVSKIKTVNEKTLEELKKRLEENSLANIKNDEKKNNLDMQLKINELYKIIAEHTETEALRSFMGSSKNSWVYTGKWKKLLQEKSLSAEKIQFLKIMYNFLNNEIDKINKKSIVSVDEIDSIVSTYQNIFNEKLGKKYNNKISILGKIQEELQNMSFNSAYGHVAGEFGEGLVALCADEIEKISIKEVSEVLKKSVVGKETSEITLNKESVSQDLSSYFKTDKTGNQYYFGKTQNKVDVKIRVNSENVLASVKNYYNPTKTGVILQSYTNLFISLAFLENQQKFGTHWLNMHAGVLKGKDRQEADEILKQEMAFEALVSGNPLKKGLDNANVFVLLDRKNGRAIVKSTKDILIKEFDSITFSPKIENIILENRKGLTAPERISKILISAHQKNIKVGLQIK